MNCRKPNDKSANDENNDYFFLVLRFIIVRVLHYIIAKVNDVRSDFTQKKTARRMNKCNVPFESVQTL